MELVARKLERRRRREKRRRSKKTKIIENVNRPCCSSATWIHTFFFVAVFATQTLAVKGALKLFPWTGLWVPETTWTHPKYDHWTFDFDNLNMGHHVLAYTLFMILLGIGCLIFKAFNFNSPSYVVGHHVFCFVLTPLPIYSGYRASQHYLWYYLPDKGKYTPHNRKHLQSFHCWVAYTIYLLMIIQFYYAIRVFCSRSIPICKKRRYVKWHRFFGVLIFYLTAYNVMHGLTTLPIDYNFTRGSLQRGYNNVEHTHTEQMQTIKYYYSSYIFLMMLLITYPLKKRSHLCREERRHRR